MLFEDWSLIFFCITFLSFMLFLCYLFQSLLVTFFLSTFSYLPFHHLVSLVLRSWYSKQSCLRYIVCTTSRWDKGREEKRREKKRRDEIRTDEMRREEISWEDKREEKKRREEKRWIEKRRDEKRREEKRMLKWAVGA